jgi:3-hydroxyisobutyrate dehydrogenase/2-hydroxy-3-oxopropionate reductase
MSVEQPGVAVVGAGAMGGRIARRLLESGVEVVVWNRSRDKLQPLEELGATAAGTPAEATRRAEVVITMVADPAALRAVTQGPDGIAAAAADGHTLIEMSTVGPAAVHELAGRLPAGVGLLDAPVLGSLSEVESGTLSIFAGGDRELFERRRGLLELLGSLQYVGPTGSGAAAKLVANSTLFGVLGALGEALALADRLGLAREAAFSVLAATPLAAQAERRRPAVESGDYPPRFALSLAHKDAGLVVEAAREAGLEPAIAEAMRRALAAADDAGWGERDYSSLLAWMLDGAAGGMSERLTRHDGREQHSDGVRRHS